METGPQGHDVHDAVLSTHACHQRAAEEVVHLGGSRETGHRVSGAGLGEHRERVALAAIAEGGADVADAQRSAESVLGVHGRQVAGKGVAGEVLTDRRGKHARGQTQGDVVGHGVGDAKAGHDIFRRERASHLATGRRDIVRLVEKHATGQADGDLVVDAEEGAQARQGVVGHFRSPHPVGRGNIELIIGKRHRCCVVVHSKSAGCRCHARAAAAIGHRIGADQQGRGRLSGGRH